MYHIFLKAQVACYAFPQVVCSSFLQNSRQKWLPPFVLTWTLKLRCAKTVRKTLLVLSPSNLTFWKIMPNVFSDTFQLIQAERYFLSFDLSVYWPEEYRYSLWESYDTWRLNHCFQVLSISVWKWRGKKNTVLAVSQVHIMNFV